MNIPRYWAKETQQLRDWGGKAFAITCWRWSDTSVEEARRLCRQAVLEIARKLLSGEKLDRYTYGERPLREEIIEEITDHENQIIAVITRNAYGALVLNAANVMFIDIDFEHEGLAVRLHAFIRRLFGTRTPNQEELLVQKIELWAETHPEWGIRVYRTRAGLRCLVTHTLFDPTQKSTVDILQSFQSDPLYIRLCRDQASFRARLTPKPWRCGADKPPSRYPWENQAAETTYRDWETRYALAASDYTVCKLIRDIGNGQWHPDVETIVSIHDRHACSDQDLELA